MENYYCAIADLAEIEARWREKEALDSSAAFWKEKAINGFKNGKRIYYYGFRFWKQAYLILIIVKIYSIFSAYRSVNHCEKRCRHIDKINSSFKTWSRKTAYIRDSSASKIYQKRISSSLSFKKFIPYNHNIIIFTSFSGINEAIIEE